MKADLHGLDAGDMTPDRTADPGPWQAAGSEPDATGPTVHLSIQRLAFFGG